jgi:hypothetical protein
MFDSMENKMFILSPPSTERLTFPEETAFPVIEKPETKIKVIKNDIKKIADTPNFFM